MAKHGDLNIMNNSKDRSIFSSTIIISCLLFILVDVAQAQVSYDADHPLYIYQQYNKVVRNMGQQDNGSIKAFLVEYKDTPLADRLRKKWLRRLAAKRDWSSYLNFHTKTKSTKMQCLHLTAMYHSGYEAVALNKVKPLWMSAKSQPEECNELFALWIKKSPPEQAVIIERINLALAKHNPQLARHLIKMIDKKTQPRINQWLVLYHNSHRVVTAKIPDDELGRIMIGTGLAQLGRRSPAQAIKAWPVVNRKYQLTDDQKNVAARALAMRLVLRSDPRATQWFDKIQPEFYDTTLREWRIRNAITHQDWEVARVAINALTEKERKKAGWTYWHARCLEQLGQKAEAEKIYKELAERRHYYGFLASQRIKAPMQMNDKRLNVINFEIQKVSNLPGMIRAKALYDLNQRTFARRELNYLQEKLNNKQKHIVATLVAKWGWPEQGILLARHSSFKDDIGIRFPLTHQDIILPNAERHALNPALIYAVIRQESGFMRHANSTAGALGLMQLMPQTARLISRETRSKQYSRTELFNPKINIRLGSYYLKKMRDKYKKHPVLFLAAYNAGHRQVSYWKRKHKPKEADIWIETLPWGETRNYIKNVISFYVVYQHRLGQKPNIDRFVQDI